MPIYEYRCNKCSKRDSYFVRTMSDNVVVACHFCGSQEMTRLVSRIGLFTDKNRYAREMDEIDYRVRSAQRPEDGGDEGDGDGFD